MIGLVAAQSPPLSAQNAAAAVTQVQANHPRGIRRDIPLTNAIRRAIDAGTRDLTGRPGPNYWQLETDFTIEARLDPATQTITGTETILIHNNSPAPLNELMMRLDHNIFRGLVPRGTSVPAENTDGMVVTRLAIDGVEISLAPAPPVGVAAVHQRSVRTLWPASIRPWRESHWRTRLQRRARRSWKSPGTRNCPAARTAEAIG